MKNKSYIKKNVNNNQKVKKKKTFTYFLVLILLSLSFVGSMLGSVAFVRTFADTEYPSITNYVSNEFDVGADLTNNYLYVPKYSEENLETGTYDYYFSELNFSIGTTFNIEFHLNNADVYIDYLSFSLTNIFKDTNEYTIFYFDLDTFNGFIEQFNNAEDTNIPFVESLVVSSISIPLVTVYYTAFSDTGSGVLGGIIGILTGGISSLGSGVGTGLSSLASSIFLDSTGDLSTFGFITLIFSALALAFGLCRLIVRWISTLGGSRV